tara:strand:- start:134 stop:358 length:225 start_codon:yes stop_codon:yes gene_type:complete
VIINWIKKRLFPLIQMEDWVINIFTRMDKLEKETHSPLFDKNQLNKIHKRLEDLETVSFVKKFGDKMKHYEGTD